MTLLPWGPAGPRRAGVVSWGGQKAYLALCVFSFEEGGRRKCGQYWPLEKNSRIRFGFLTVTNLGVENMNHYKKTTLEIHNTEVNPGFYFLTFFKLRENLYCKENLQKE